MSWTPGFDVPTPDPADEDFFATFDTVTTSLESTYLSADHVMHPALDGTFTPQSAEVEVEVSVNGPFVGVAHQNLFFAWNQDVTPGEPLMTGEGFAGDAFVAGTSRKTVGPLTGPGNTGLSQRRFRLTGLTPGVPVTWELVSGATGYYEKIDYAAGSFPVALALSNDHRTLYVSLFSAGKVLRYDPGNRWMTDGLMVPKGEWGGHAGAYDMAMHPTDSTKMYLVRRSANQVVELDTRTGEVLRAFSVTNPLYMTISEDATKLFVVRQDAHNDAIPITLSNGTVGSSIGLGTTPWRPVARDGYVYVACSSSNRIDRIDVSSHAVTSLATGGTTTPVALALDPTGDRMWVLEKAGTKRLRAISTTTFDFTADTAVTPLNGQSPNFAMISPSGKSAVVLSSGTGNDLETFALPAMGVIYESGTAGDMGVGVLSQEGDIFALNVIDAGALHHWHAARLEIDPADEFWGGLMEVVVTGATAL